jgi:2-polyprenyl-3-methyl-5-hydroxy-6-metoxy-1,4-benzoquinol methylase
MKNLSYKTAIVRKKLSSPTQYLLDNELIRGRVLDYGCGKGFDCDWLKCHGYDPHHRNVNLHGKYDTILCNFVLNVLRTKQERDFVANTVFNLLEKGGNAFFAVRNDKGKLNGKTKIGTYQCLVTMRLPILKKTSGYLIFWLGK